MKRKKKLERKKKENERNKAAKYEPIDSELIEQKKTTDRRTKKERKKESTRVKNKPTESECKKKNNYTPSCFLAFIL